MVEMVHKISQQFGGTPSSYYFDCGTATHLRGKLNDFTLLLTLFHNGEIAPAHFFEEAHTILELLLRNALSERDRGSFGSMVGVAEDLGLVPVELAKDLLILKDARRDSKHRGQTPSPRLAMELSVPVIVACHRLLETIRGDQPLFHSLATAINRLETYLRKAIAELRIRKYRLKGLNRRRPSNKRIQRAGGGAIGSVESE